MTRRLLSGACAALLFIAALTGCAKKADETAGTTTTDSLLAASPIETPQGELTPSSETPQQPDQSAPPVSTPKPRSTPPRRTPTPTPTPVPREDPGVLVPAGTGIEVTMDAAISSETAKPGDSWTGTVKSPLVVGSAAPIPAGAKVHGVVEAAEGAAKGSRAFLVLRATSVEVNGRSQSVSATADSLVAGSTRKRNVGAIAGSAAAGALIGKAIGGSNKGAVIGGILGGAAATGAVAASKGFQVDVPENAQLAFRFDYDARIKQ